MISSLRLSECKNIGSTKICSFLNKRDRFSFYTIAKKRFYRNGLNHDLHNKIKEHKIKYIKHKRNAQTVDKTNAKQDAVEMQKINQNRTERNIISIINSQISDGNFVENFNVIDSSVNGIMQKCTPEGCINVVG